MASTVYETHNCFGGDMSPLSNANHLLDSDVMQKMHQNKRGGNKQKNEKNLNKDFCCLYKKKSFIAVDISSNLCGISGVKVWDP